MISRVRGIVNTRRNDHNMIHVLSYRLTIIICSLKFSHSVTFFVCQTICVIHASLLNVRPVRVRCMKVKRQWVNIIIVNYCAPTKDKDDETKTMFRGRLDVAYDYYPCLIKLMLGQL